MMIIDSNPSIVSGQIKIKAKKLIQPKTSVKQIAIAHKLSGNELIRINDKTIYQENRWKCPRN